MRRVVSSLLQASGVVPTSKVADIDLGESVVFNVDIAIFVTHPEKEQVALTFKKTLCHHPTCV